MTAFRGNACLSWVDSDDVNTERVLLLREPLRELRPAGVQSVYTQDSLDFTQRATYTIGQGVDELVGKIRFMDDPQGCIDLLKAGSKQRTITYLPDLDDPTRNFACYLISPLLPNQLSMDGDMGTTFGLREFEIRLRRTDGKAFDLGWAYEQGMLFRYVAGGRLKDATFTRGSTGTYFDKFGILQTAAINLTRIEWVDTNSDGVLDSPTLLLEASRTNVALWNRDLTNAAWVKTNVTPVKDQTGIDGVASSASRITATAGNGTCLQSVTLASSARYQTAWVKRLVGSGTINMTTDNGATWTAIVPTTSWTRLSIPTQTLANPILGFRIVTNADSIAVDFVQNENGVFQTSAIPTTTVAVTRSADSLSIPFTPKPQPMWVYFKFRERGDALQTGSLGVLAIGSATASWNFFGTAAGQGYSLELWNVINQGTGALGNVPTYDQSVELLGILTSSLSLSLRQSVNGGVETPAGPSTITLPSVFTTLAITPNMDRNGTPGYSAFHSIKFGTGVVTTIAQVRGL